MATAKASKAVNSGTLPVTPPLAPAPPLSRARSLRLCFCSCHTGGFLWATLGAPWWLQHESACNAGGLGSFLDQEDPLERNSYLRILALENPDGQEAGEL